MTKEQHITTKQLREILHYDPKTGSFTWKKLEWINQVRAGHAAGCINRCGYIQISIAKRIYTAHRLAWLYMKGRWPTEEIDHINLDRSDNRFCNLREATHAQNQRNIRAQKNNRSKRKGIYWHKRAEKWASCIMVDGKNKHLGLFEKIDDAAEAYAATAKKHFGKFARLR